METAIHTVPSFTAATASGAIGVALVFITVMSLVKEPGRQKINALLIAGAGAVYWSGGLGVWEFVFGTVMLFVAYRGFTRYYFIGIGWLLHTGWDIMHHLYGNPLIVFDPSSSAGCAVCDAVLALWFFMGAPSVFGFFRKKNTIPA